MKISIIIPVFNEVKTINEIIQNVMNTPYNKEVIVINDGSNDGTNEFLNDYKKYNPIKLINLDKNHGKGYAVREGIKHVTGDIVLIQDADLEYHPDEYGTLIQKIVEDKADAVYGSRFLGAHRVFLFYHYLGNNILNLFANILYNTTLSDLMTCYKVFKVEVIKSLKLKSNRFDIEPEITGEIFKRNYIVYEVPISYSGRSYSEGKKIRYLDFFICLWRLIEVKMRFISTKRKS